MIAVWWVRASRDGEHEDVALEKGLAVIGCAELPLKRVWTLVLEE